MPENETQRPISTESLHAGYETTDASVRGILLVALLVLVLAVAIHLAVAWLFHHDERAVRASQTPRSALPHEVAMPPEPRLQLNPRADLAELRERNLAILTSAAWVDRQQGWVRIPIEDAMDLLVAQARRPEGNARKGAKKR